MGMDQKRQSPPTAKVVGLATNGAGGFSRPLAGEGPTTTIDDNNGGSMRLTCVRN